MAAKEIPLDQIKDNPFQARQSFDKVLITSLANEIKEEGFWNTVLQGRKVNGKVELVFGHRRLRALRELGVKSVRIEVLDLTDEQMALRGLEENFQREGLTDLEKADAVRTAIDLLEKKKITGAVMRVSQRLNIDHGWITNLRKISVSIDTKTRKLIQAGYLSAKTAMLAKEWGGDEFVTTLAARGKEHKESDTTITKPTETTVAAFKKAVKAIDDEAIKERITKEVIEGKIDDPKEVAPRARRLASAKVQRTKHAPPDLRVVCMEWTKQFKDFAAKLKEVRPYMDYVDEDDFVAQPFRNAVANLIEALKAL